ncbi:MAG: monovalent cation:proton antiporter-2 (CPA2) family protein [Gammaproteobacteria bacterium]
MHHSPLGAVLILLALSVAAVALVRRIHLPPILGYLFVGLAAGPHALGWIPENEVVHLLGEVGVVFLLFMIGLEISIPHLLSMRHAVLVFGGAQVVLSTLVTMAMAMAGGIPWQGALVVGGALALSSTAIVAKQLTEQVEMQSRHGRYALGILLFQDLAVVPFLVVIPILGGGAADSLGPVLLLALAKGLAVLVAMLAAGRWLLRPLFHWVASAHSVELFTLTVLLVSLTAAWLTWLAGLSLALGAFIAGMLIGDTEYRHHVETEIRPFRDVLMGLFFITVGTQLDLAALPGIAHWVLLLVVGLVIVKGLLIAGVVRLGGHDSGLALRTGIVLAQGGEFGFALLALALAHGLLTAEQSQPVLAAMVVSMALAPLLIRRNGQLAALVSRSYRRHQETEAHVVEEGAAQLSGHVIIGGFGRIGQNLALFLDTERIDYLALDMDPTLISEAWEAGQRVFFANAAHPEILEAAGLARARALVLAFDDYQAAEQIIPAVRRLNRDIPIIVRAHDDSRLETLEAAGATEVVPESVEASLILASRLLNQLGVDLDEIQRVVEQARTDHYRRVRCYFHGGDELETPEALEDQHRLHTVVLSPDHHAVGRRIDELGLDDLDVEVLTVRRAGICGDAPDPAMTLRSGDALILQGDAEHLFHAEAQLLRNQDPASRS